MKEEEIIERIEICKRREEEYREVGNTRRAETYKNEYLKWEELIDKLNPENYKQLTEYRRGYTRLENNWNELKKWLEETIKQYDNVGLKFKKASNFECASRSYDYLKQYQTMLDKMQEMEQGKDE